MNKILIEQAQLTKIFEKLNSIESSFLAEKRVLTFNEMVRYSGLSKSYLYKLTSAGMIPHYKPNGKNIFFEKAEVEAWLLSCKVTTREELDIKAINYTELHGKSKK